MELDSFNLFISWEYASDPMNFSRDSDDFRRWQQVLDQAEELWKRWIEINRGNIISLDNFKGRAEVPVDKIDELSTVKENIEKLIKIPISIGIGMHLRESDRALNASKKKQNGHITLWTEELLEEDLQKTQIRHRIGLFRRGAGAGMQPYEHPKKPKVEQPIVSKPESTPNFKPLSAPKQNQEETEDSGSLEDKLHDLASEESETQVSPQQETPSQDIKTNIAKVLQKVKKQAPVLEQLAHSSPNLYRSIVELTQAVIKMAKLLPQDSQIAKSEITLKDLNGGKSEGLTEEDFDPEDLKEGMLVELEHTKDREVAKKIAMDHLTENKKYYKKLKVMEKELDKSASSFPVGAQKDGKVKVLNENGGTKWVGGKSGLILGPNGQPESALRGND